MPDQALSDRNVCIALHGDVHERHAPASHLGRSVTSSGSVLGPRISARLMPQSKKGVDILNGRCGQRLSPLLTRGKKDNLVHAKTRVFEDFVRVRRQKDLRAAATRNTIEDRRQLLHH